MPVGPGTLFPAQRLHPADIWFDSEVFVRTLSEFQQRYRFDGFLINVPGRPPDWRRWLSGQRRENGRQVLTWNDGLVTSFPPDDNPHTTLADGGDLPRADPAQVDPADPATYRVPGYVWNTWHAPTMFDVPADADLADPAAYPDWLTLGLRLRSCRVPGRVRAHGGLLAADAPAGVVRLPAGADGAARLRRSCAISCWSDSPRWSRRWCGATGRTSRTRS